MSLSYVRVGIYESVFQRVVQCFVVDLTETGLDHFDAVVFTPVVDGREARHGIRFGPNFCIRPVYRFGPFVLSITTNWIHKCINFCFKYFLFVLPLVRGSSFSLAKTPRLPGWIDTKTDTINRHERQLCRVNGRHGRVQLESWMLIIDWHGYPRWEKRRTTILSALSDNGLIFFGEWFYQTFDIHLVITTPKFRCTTQQILLNLREPKGRDPLCFFDRPALASNCYLNSKHFVQSQSLVGLVFFFK